MTAPDLYRLPELYDAQYARYRDDVPFYRRLVDDHGGPVLELGAGTGRVTEALARSGAEIVAVEPSAPMRARAATRLADAGLGAGVTLLDGDMRNLALERRFALVLAPFNALMHLHDLAAQDAALSGARRHLLAGGAFAADVYVPRFGPMGVLRREEEWREVGGAHAELWLWQRHDRLAQVIESHYLLDEIGPDGVVTRRRARLVQRYYRRFELLRALRAAGLGDVRLFGDFAGGPLREESRVMAAVARP